MLDEALGNDRGVMVRLKHTKNGAGRNVDVQGVFIVIGDMLI